MPLGVLIGAGVGYAAGGTIAAAALGATLGGAAGSYISGRNAPSAGQISGTASAEQQTIFSEQQLYEQQLQELIANPSSVTKLPGYDFLLKQGSEAVARGAGPTVGSGAEMAALAQYGQGLATSFYQTQTGLLAQLAGITAPSSPSQLSGASTAAQSSSWQQTFAALSGLGTFAGKYGSAGTPAASSGGGSGGGPLWGWLSNLFGGAGGGGGGTSPVSTIGGESPG